MAFLFAYFVRSRYAVAVFFVTIMLVLMTESMMEVHLEFTITRLLSNLTGGVLALLAALFFWPKWEQERFPQIFASALRANRKYLETIAAHITAGTPFVGDAIQRKREVERANSESAASVQRLIGEPSSRQKNLEQIAALATYNQRLTRTLTVLGQYLNKRKAFAYAHFESDVKAIGEAIESFAKNLEAESLSQMVVPPKIEMPHSGNLEAELIYGQLTKVVTELEAMMLEVKMSFDATVNGASEDSPKKLSSTKEIS
jgi:uncharacterized membrane protein YccC